ATGAQGKGTEGKGGAPPPRGEPVELRLQPHPPRQPPALRQHLRREVDGEDTGAVAGQGEGGEPRTRADVEGPVGGSRGGEASDRLQALAAAVQSALGVAAGVAGVLGLRIAGAGPAPFEAHLFGVSFTCSSGRWVSLAAG